MSTHRTAEDLSPEELAPYRRRLDQQFQNRKVDEALLQRASSSSHALRRFWGNTSCRIRFTC